MTDHREPEHYTTGEIARSAGLVGLAVLRSLTGRSITPVDRRIAKLQQDAVEREAAEAKAREDAAKVRAAKAAKRR